MTVSGILHYTVRVRGILSSYQSHAIVPGPFWAHTLRRRLGPRYEISRRVRRETVCPCTWTNLRPPVWQCGCLSQSRRTAPKTQVGGLHRRHGRLGKLDERGASRESWPAYRPRMSPLHSHSRAHPRIAHRLEMTLRSRRIHAL